MLIAQLPDLISFDVRRGSLPLLTPAHGNPFEELDLAPAGPWMGLHLQARSSQLILSFWFVIRYAYARLPCTRRSLLAPRDKTEGFR
jgi:hypothetical protein